jgi:hypothetical protein
MIFKLLGSWPHIFLKQFHVMFLDVLKLELTCFLTTQAESAPVPSNFETWHHDHIIHQLVSVPTIPGQLYPTVSPPATINVHSPLRTKVRRRWTTEMHDRFIDAVNQLGGCESKISAL